MEGRWCVNTFIQVSFISTKVTGLHSKNRKESVNTFIQVSFISTEGVAERDVDGWLCQYLYSGFLHFYKGVDYDLLRRRKCVNTFIQVSFISTKQETITKAVKNIVSIPLFRFPSFLRNL